ACCRPHGCPEVDGAASSECSAREPMRDCRGHRRNSRQLRAVGQASQEGLGIGWPGLRVQMRHTCSSTSLSSERTLQECCSAICSLTSTAQLSSAFRLGGAAQMNRHGSHRYAREPHTRRRGSLAPTARSRGDDSLVRASGTSCEVQCVKLVGLGSLLSGFSVLVLRFGFRSKASPSSGSGCRRPEVNRSSVRSVLPWSNERLSGEGPMLHRWKAANVKGASLSIVPSGVATRAGEASRPMLQICATSDKELARIVRGLKQLLHNENGLLLRFKQRLLFHGNIDLLDVSAQVDSSMVLQMVRLPALA
ncbi:unnamed protein product, partial [Symbiodinium sp. CCMP2456]